jgi:hypothetical protein
MNTHNIKLSNGVTTFLGKMIVGDNALYFLCTSKGSALLEGAGIGLGGGLGGVLQALSDKGDYGQLPADTNEEDIQNALKSMPSSIKFDAGKIEIIQQNWLFRMIKWDGKKIGVPSGFSKELKQELIPWAKKHGIKIKGF